MRPLQKITTKCSSLSFEYVSVDINTIRQPSNSIEGQRWARSWPVGDTLATIEGNIYAMLRLMTHRILLTWRFMAAAVIGNGLTKPRVKLGSAMTSRWSY